MTHDKIRVTFVDVTTGDTYHDDIYSVPQVKGEEGSTSLEEMASYAHKRTGSPNGAWYVTVKSLEYGGRAEYLFTHHAITDIRDIQHTWS